MANSTSVYATRQAGGLTLFGIKVAGDIMGIPRAAGRRIVLKQLIAESCLDMP